MEETMRWSDCNLPLRYEEEAFDYAMDCGPLTSCLKPTRQGPLLVGRADEHGSEPKSVVQRQLRLFMKLVVFRNQTIYGRNTKSLFPCLPSLNRFVCSSSIAVTLAPYFLPSQCNILIYISFYRGFSSYFSRRPRCCNFLSWSLASSNSFKRATYLTVEIISPRLANNVVFSMNATKFSM